MSRGRNPQAVLFVSGSAASATLRYRVRLPEEGLRSRGIRTAALHFTDPRIRHLAPLADVIVLYRCPAGSELLALLSDLRRQPSPPLLVYDIDDLVFSPELCDGLPFLTTWTPAQRATFEREVALRARCIPHVDLLTGSTEGVLAELSRLSSAPIALLPNGIGRVGLSDAKAASSEPRPAGGLRIGYFSGSATHDEDWAQIEPAVIEALRADSNTRLWLVGKVRPGRELAAVRGQVRTVRPVSWRALPRLLREVDVTLAPLARSPFTDAKSAIKWLEAALVGTPTIATGSPPFRAVIEHGRTGFIADTPDEWLACLLRLADAPAERLAVGNAANLKALAAFDPDTQVERLLTAWSGAEVGTGATTPTDDIAPPELWRTAPVLLQSYPWPPGTEEVTLDLPPEAAAESRRLVRAAKSANLGSRALAVPRKLPYRALSAARRLGGRARIG